MGAGRGGAGTSVGAAVGRWARRPPPRRSNSMNLYAVLLVYSRGGGHQGPERPYQDVHVLNDLTVQGQVRRVPVHGAPLRVRPPPAVPTAGNEAVKGGRAGGKVVQFSAQGPEQCGLSLTANSASRAAVAGGRRGGGGLEGRCTDAGPAAALAHEREAADTRPEVLPGQERGLGACAARGGCPCYPHEAPAWGGGVTPLQSPRPFHRLGTELEEVPGRRPGRHPQV